MMPGHNVVAYSIINVPGLHENGACDITGMIMRSWLNPCWQAAAFEIS